LPAQDALDWLVVMGGPMNIYEEERYPWLVAEKRFIAQVVEAGKTVLGICLGAQLIADVLGAPIVKGPHPEIGWFPVIRDPAADHTKVGRVLPASFEAFHWHGDTFMLPKDAVPLGRSEACACQGFVYKERVLALQFHLETTAASAEALIEHCGAEIGNGPYEQAAAEMLVDPGRFDRLNALMKTLADTLADS
jgi:GMP synthase (glutamine-hydrolysing)